MKETQNLKLKTYDQTDGQVKYLDYRLATSENFQKLDDFAGNTAEKKHEHTKDEITDFPESMKNPNALKLQFDGVDNVTYDGETEQTFNVTKGAISLGNVENFGVASKAEAINPDVKDKYMTPFLVSEAIKALGSSDPVELKQQIKSVMTTVENQKEIDIPFDFFDQTLHLLEVRVGGVPFFHERYTISADNKKVVLKDNEIGIINNKRVDFIVTYLEQVGNNRLPINGNNLINGTVSMDKLNDELKNLINQGGGGGGGAIGKHADTHGVGGTDPLTIVEDMLAQELKDKINNAGGGGGGGNSSTADKLTTARKINLTGAITGTTDFDGSKDVEIQTTVNHTHTKDQITDFAHTHTKADIADFPESLKSPNALTISLNSVSQGAYDGSSVKNINITPASIGALASNGTAVNANKVANALTISLNGTSQGAYNGSSAKTINITPASIGASATSHTHNYAPNNGIATQSEAQAGTNNTKYMTPLRVSEAITALGGKIGWARIYTGGSTLTGSSNVDSGILAARTVEGSVAVKSGNYLTFSKTGTYMVFADISSCVLTSGGASGVNLNFHIGGKNIGYAVLYSGENKRIATLNAIGKIDVTSTSTTYGVSASASPTSSGQSFTVTFSNVEYYFLKIA